MLKRLCLDLDGVLSNHVLAMAKLHNISPEWKALGKWRFRDGLGIPDPWWKGIDYKFWHDMEKMPKADELVKIILGYFKPEDICITTSLPTRDNDFPFELVGESVQGKIDWLRHNFPKLSNNFMIGPSKHFCADASTLLIDDLDISVDEFSKSGGLALLVPRPWNSLYAYSGDIIERLQHDLRSVGGHRAP